MKIKSFKTLQILSVSFFSLQSALAHTNGYDLVKDLNANMAKARQEKASEQTTTLGQQTAKIISGQSSKITYDRRANDEERDIAQQSIMHKLIHSIAQKKKIFSLKACDDTSDNYIGHLSFIAVNHMAILELLKHRAGFLYTLDDLINRLQASRLQNFNFLKIKNENVRQALQRKILGYSRETIQEILGSKLMNHYLDASRSYPDVMDQWLIQVRDINDRRPGAGRVYQGSATRFTYFNGRNEEIAVEVREEKEIDKVRSSSENVAHNGKYFIQVKQEFTEKKGNNEATNLVPMEHAETADHIKLTSLHNLMPLGVSNGQADEELYNKGLMYRNANDPQMAIECFLPLARKGHVILQQIIGRTERRWPYGFGSFSPIG